MTYKSKDEMLGGSARNSYSGGGSVGTSGSTMVIWGPVTGGLIYRTKNAIEECDQVEGGPGM